MWNKQVNLKKLNFVLNEMLKKYTVILWTNWVKQING